MFKLKKTNALIKKAFKLEPLESRFLLSADPILGAAHIALHGDLNTEHDPIAVFEQTYHPLQLETTQASLTQIQQAQQTLAQTQQDTLQLDFVDQANASYNDPYGTVHITQDLLDEWLNLAGDTLVIGGEWSGQHFIFGEQGLNENLIVDKDVIIMNPLEGGHNTFYQGLSSINGASIEVIGSGNTQNWGVSEPQTFTSDSGFPINDSITIDNDVTVNAKGNIVLGGASAGHYLDGVSGTNNRLTLNPNFELGTKTHHVTINSTIGLASALDGLTIKDAVNVTFEQSVHVKGDIVIEASGSVNFKSNMIIEGDLIVKGASQIFFGNDIEVTFSDGERYIYLQADSLNLPQNKSQAIKNNGGVLVIETTTLGRDIAIASPPGVNSSTTLDISNKDLQSLQAGFGKIIIGREALDEQGNRTGKSSETGGNVRIGARPEAQQFSFFDPVEIYGRTITVEDFQNAGHILGVESSLGLVAYKDIVIKNTIDNFSSAQPITLYSETGSIIQQDSNDLPTSELIRTDTLNVQSATGTTLLWTEINNLNAVNTGDSGDIRIHTQGSGAGGTTNANLNIQRIAQTNASAAGDIIVSTDNGNITLLATGASNIQSGQFKPAKSNITSTVDTLIAAGSQITHAGTGEIVLVAATDAKLLKSKAEVVGAKLTDDGKTITLNNNVVSAQAGHITIVADGLIAQNANVHVSSAGGTIHYRSVQGSIQMAATSLTDASTAGDAGTVIYEAGNSIVLGQINAKTAINLTADTNNSGIGSITSAAGVGSGDNRALNLSGETQTVTLRASQGIGTSAVHLKTEIAGLLARNTLSGGIFIQETTDLELKKGIDETNADLGLWLSGSAVNAGNAVFTLLNGSFTATGQMLLEGASGNLLVDTQRANTDPRDANIAINEKVTSNNGSVSLLAANAIAFGTTGLVETLVQAKTIELLATAGAISMANNAAVRTNAGNVRIDASESVVVGLVDTRISSDRSSTPESLTAQQDWGSVGIKASAQSISDASSDDGVIDIYANNLRIEAGTHIAQGDNHLETEVINLALKTQDGGIYITESSALSIGNVKDIQVNRVGVDGSAALQVEDIDNTLTGVTVDADAVQGDHDDIVIINKQGDFVIDGALNIAGNANIRLEATAGKLEIKQNLTTGTGHITAIAGEELDFNAAQIKTSGGDIDLQAQGNIEFGVADARTTESLDTQDDWGSVIARSVEGSILDKVNSQVTNVFANQLRLDAKDSIGAHDNHLELEVARLSAKAEGVNEEEIDKKGIYLTEDTALTLRNVGVIQRVGVDGLASNQQDGSNQDLTWSNVDTAGNLVLQTNDGELDTLADTGEITVAGNLLLKAGGNSADLTLGASLTNSAGHTSLEAGRDILLNANISATADAKTIDLKAGDDIIMATDTSITSTNGNIRLEAGNANTGDSGVNGIALRTITAGTANVALIANNSGSIVDAASDATTNITANGLILKAGTEIGSGTNHIDTSVTTLSASAGSGGVFVTESNNLIVDKIDFDISRVNSQAGDADQNSKQEDLRTTDNGAIVLNVAAGNLTLKGGADSAGLVASGSGNVLLNVVAGDLKAKSAIDAGTGSISILSSGSQIYAAAGDITTAGNGTIDLWAKGASVIEMDGATTFKTNGGNIRLVSSEITLGTLDARNGTQIQSDWGSISLITANDIVAAANSSENIWSNELRIEAKGFGALDKAIETEVALLAAKIGETGLYLNEASALTIGTTTEFSVERVISTGFLASTKPTDDVLSKIVSAGHISLHTNRTLTLAQNVEATGASTIDLRAGTNNSSDLVMQAGVSVMSVNSDIRLEAGGDIQLRTVTAGTGNVALIATAGSITDANNDANANITAHGLLLKAGNGIGKVDGTTNFIETAVSLLSAHAGAGGVFIHEANGLTIDTLTVNVNRIHLEDGETNPVAKTQEDLKTSDNGTIVLVVKLGDLTLNGGADLAGLVASGSGNVLLNVVAGDLEANAAIDAGTGSISIHSSGKQTYASAGDITTRETGTIDIQASEITMTDGAVTTAGSGNIRYHAEGAIALGQLTTAGNISLTASNITDNNGETNNLTADQLRIVTFGTADGQGAGTGANHLKINVAKLAADIKGTGTGGLYLTEANALQIGTLDAINVNQVGTDGVTLVATTDAAQSNLSSASHLVLQTLAGSLTTQAAGGAITAAGNMLIKAGGNSSDLTLGASLTNTAGHTSLEAGQDILLNANISVTADTKTIDLKAGDDIIMAENTSITSTNGNIRLEAENTNNDDEGVNGIALRTINAGSAHVALMAGEAGSIVDAADTDAVNITASGLILKAGYALGSGTNHINTTVATLSASAGSGGMFVTETNTLVVGQVDFNISRVGFNAEVPEVNLIQSLQEDLRTTGNGALALVIKAGKLTLNAGTEQPGLVASGSGNVLLDIKDGEFEANAAIDAGTGSISIHSSGKQTYASAGDITTRKTGTIDIRASAISMTNGAVTTAGSGNIRYHAEGAIALGQLTTAGNISLSASTITDNNGDTNNLTANQLRIVTTGEDAGMGAGTGGNHLEINVAKLAADIKGTGAGGLYLTASQGLTIGLLGAISVNQVNTAGLTPESINDAALSKLNSQAHLVIVSAGSVISESTNGDITAAGNILIKTTGTESDITLNANVTSTTGHISLNAGRDLLQNAGADIEAVAEFKTIDVLAARAITMANGTQTISNNGNIRYAAKPTGASTAANVLTLSSLNAGTGNISLLAGSILDGGDSHTDIIANELRLHATVGIGNNGTTINAIDTQVSVLSARSGAQGLFINEAGTLTIDRVAAIKVNTVGTDATLSDSIDEKQEDVITEANGSIVLEANALTIKPGESAGIAINAKGSGHILLNARAGNLDLQGQVDGGTGHVTLLAEAIKNVEDSGKVVMHGIAGVVSINGATSTPGTVYIDAETSITMESGASILTNGGNVGLTTQGDIRLGIINTLRGSTIAGSVSLITTGGAVLDNQNPDDAVNILTNALLIDAHSGVASSGNRLETQVSHLTVNSSHGSVFMHDTTSVEVRQVTVEVKKVSHLAALDNVVKTQADIKTNTGSIVLSATTSLTLIDGDANGFAIQTTSGNVRLSTDNQNITVNSKIDVAAGNLTLEANSNIAINTDGRIQTTAGTLDLIAKTGAITMNGESWLKADGGNIRLEARGNVTLGIVDARKSSDKSYAEQSLWGNVSVVAGLNGTSGSIVDAHNDDAGELVVNIYAKNLRMDARTAVGAGGNHIETEVLNLAARASNGGIFVTEATAINVDSVADVTVNRVNTAGIHALTTAGAALSDLTTAAGNGHIVLRASAGDITLKDGDTNGHAIRAHGTGNILVQTLTSGSIFANTDILSTSGHISIIAQNAVDFTSGSDVRTSQAGAIHIEAQTGSITQHDNSLFTTGSGVINLHADQDAKIGGINTTGHAAISATKGSISDAGDTYVDVVANGLRLNAGIGIGSTTADGVVVNALETTVTTLSATATSGGIYIQETNAIMIDDVTVNVTKVDQTGGASSANLATQSDLRTTSGNGNVVLQTTAGSITLREGSQESGASGAVGAHGSGNILLSAGGTTSDILLGSNITTVHSAHIATDNGHISLLAGRHITAYNSFVTTGYGTIDLQATLGTIDIRSQQTTNTTISSTSGDVRLWAQKDIKLAGKISTTAHLSLTANTGSITENTENTDVNLQANGLRLWAGNAIGAGDNAIETQVTSLTARAAGGGIYLLESDDVKIDDVEVTVNRVTADGSVTNSTQVDIKQSDLITVSGNGHIVLQATAGSITLNDGSATNDVDGTAIQAHGTGNILVQTLTSGSIIAHSDITSTNGNISLIAAQGIEFKANADIRTASTAKENGTIDLQAETGNITMDASSLFTSSGATGHIRLLAQNNITVGTIQTQDATVSLTATEGSILDLENDTRRVAISAVNLMMSAGQAIGASDNHLDIAVNTLSTVSTAGGTFLTESDAITIDTLSLSINRVATTGVSTATQTQAQQEMRSGAELVLSTLNGAITTMITTGEISAAGNIRLDAQGAGSNLTLGHSLTSHAGHISLKANATLTQQATGDITISTGAGSLDVSANAIDMKDGAISTAQTGHIRYVASNTLTLGQLTTSGDISLRASNITDANGESNNLTA
ncbi:LEPR-XLL domain-containing protein, partial [Thiomicrospira microaerophila]|uniref:LEPR-XLL domain-containing protein n=1 Tax=Thiomicrospira microaerophila TaxID=406020 RepID=UPI000A551F3E